MDVVAYVDGLNLYYGLKSKYGRDFLWLDLVALVRKMRAEDNVIKVRYFASIVRGDVDAAARQEIYLSALSAHSPELEITRGYFKKKNMRCGLCRRRWECAGCVPPRLYRTYEEKLTDVALGVAMTKDAAQGYGDLSLLISTDADFRPAIEATLDLAPERRIMIACPPGREAPETSLSPQVSAFPIRKRQLREAQLPEQVYAVDGKIYQRPEKWSEKASTPI